MVNEGHKKLIDADFGEKAGVSAASEGARFELWGYRVQILLDADKTGPTSDQRKLCHKLRANEGSVRQRVEEVVRREIESAPELTAPSTNPINPASIFLPSNPQTANWRIWPELSGEDLFSFGAEVKPSGEIFTFSED